MNFSCDKMLYIYKRFPPNPDVCCCLLYKGCRSTDTNSYPLTHRATVDKRAADKFDH